jgi:hypothetical protein
MPGYYSLDEIGVYAGYIGQERRREAEEQRCLRLAERNPRRLNAPPRRRPQTLQERVPAFTFCDAWGECR